MANKKGAIFRLLFWHVLIFLVALYPLFRIGGKALVGATFLGFALSLINTIFGYSSIRWGFGRSTKTFFLVVLGGMAMRLVVFGLALYLIWRFTHLPLLGFIISFILFYLLLQYYEVRLVTQELRNGKK